MDADTDPATDRVGDARLTRSDSLQQQQVRASATSQARGTTRQGGTSAAGAVTPVVVNAGGTVGMDVPGAQDPDGSDAGHASDVDIGARQEPVASKTAAASDVSGAPPSLGVRDSVDTAGAGTSGEVPHGPSSSVSTWAGGGAGTGATAGAATSVTPDESPVDTSDAGPDSATPDNCKSPTKAGATSAGATCVASPASDSDSSGDDTEAADSAPPKHWGGDHGCDDTIVGRLHKYLGRAKALPAYKARGRKREGDTTAAVEVPKRQPASPHSFQLVGRNTRGKASAGGASDVVVVDIDGATDSQRSMANQQLRFGQHHTTPPARQASLTTDRIAQHPLKQGVFCVPTTADAGATGPRFIPAPDTCSPAELERDAAATVARRLQAARARMAMSRQAHPHPGRAYPPSAGMASWGPGYRGAYGGAAHSGGFHMQPPRSYPGPQRRMPMTPAYYNGPRGAMGYGRHPSGYGRAGEQQGGAMHSSHMAQAWHRGGTGNGMQAGGPRGAYPQHLRPPYIAAGPPQRHQQYPNQPPPGAMPPGAMPPGAMPAGAMPPGAMPPGAMPPRAMPPGYGPQPTPHVGARGSAFPGAPPYGQGGGAPAHDRSRAVPAHGYARMDMHGAPQAWHRGDPGVDAYQYAGPRGLGPRGPAGPGAQDYGGPRQPMLPYSGGRAQPAEVAPYTAEYEPHGDPLTPGATTPAPGPAHSTLQHAVARQPEQQRQPQRQQLTPTQQHQQQHSLQPRQPREQPQPQPQPPHQQQQQRQQQQRRQHRRKPHQQPEARPDKALHTANDPVVPPMVADAASRKPWTGQEDATLCAAVSSLGLDFEAVVSEHFPGSRTVDECKNRWILVGTPGAAAPSPEISPGPDGSGTTPQRGSRKVYTPFSTAGVQSGAWTRREDAALRAGVLATGQQDFSTISEVYLRGTRTEHQCSTRWNQVLKPGLVKGPWSATEDQIIRNCVESGITSWVRIADHVPGRVGKQCRERWYNHLVPGLKKTPWTAEEDATLLELMKVHGHKWRTIAKLMPGRTANNIKNRYNCRVAKQESARLRLKGLRRRAPNSLGATRGTTAVSDALVSPVSVGSSSTLHDDAAPLGNAPSLKPRPAIRASAGSSLAGTSGGPVDSSGTPANSAEHVTKTRGAPTPRSNAAAYDIVTDDTDSDDSDASLPVDAVSDRAVVAAEKVLPQAAPPAAPPSPDGAVTAGADDAGSSTTSTAVMPAGTRRATKPRVSRARRGGVAASAPAIAGTAGTTKLQRRRRSSPPTRRAASRGAKSAAGTRPRRAPAPAPAPSPAPAPAPAATAPASSRGDSATASVRRSSRSLTRIATAATSSLARDRHAIVAALRRGATAKAPATSRRKLPQKRRRGSDASAGVTSAGGEAETTSPKAPKKARAATQRSGPQAQGRPVTRRRGAAAASTRGAATTRRRGSQRAAAASASTRKSRRKGASGGSDDEEMVDHIDLDLLE